MTKPNVVDVDRIAKLRYDFVDLRIGDERVKTRIADTQQKRYVGLSRSEELGKNEGMLFMYDQEKKHRLVMRDMDYALDVIHVGADGRVNKVGSMSEDGEAVEGVSKYAIEVPHGWCEKQGVDEGDPVHIMEPPEEKQKFFKARRYVDNPNEVPEGYEPEEGPEGGIYYETEESEEEAGVGDYGRDDLREIAGDNFYVETDVSIDDLSANSKGPFIVDRGDGPERVTAAGRLEAGAVDDDEDHFYWDNARDTTPASEIEVLAAINPKRDEHGHLIDPEIVDIEKPESHEDFRTRGISQEKKEQIAEHHGGDWWENRDAAEDMKNMAMNRIYEAYGSGEGSTGGEVWGVLESWTRKGYNMQSELWEAAMAMTGKETVPEHLADYDRHGVGDTDPDVLQALCDIIRFSRETAREEFGDTVTVTRAIDGHTFRQYSRETDEGIEIKPNIMESWSIDPDGAQEWAEHKATGSGIQFGNHETGPDYVIVEKEFDVEDVAYHGAATLGATNESYKELTMAPQDDVYSVSDENVDRSNLLSEEELPDYMKQDDEPPRMPWHASQWMYDQGAESEGQSTKSEILSALSTLTKARRYVDSPEEVPDQYEVQEGPQGGLYYETGSDAEEEEEGMNLAALEGEDIVFETEDGQLEGEVDVAFSGESIRVDTDEGWFMIAADDIVGRKDELLGDEVDDGVDDIAFEDLQEGHEIVFEDYKGNTQVGEVTRLWDDRDNITVVADGTEYAVHPEDYEGIADEFGDSAGVDIESDDLTGHRIEFENGETGVVLNGEGSGLHVEMLTGPNQGEDIYGISRDSIDDVLEDEIDEDFGEGWESPDIDEMELEEQSDWVRDNAYVHQNLKVYDRATGEVREGFIDADKLNKRTGNAYVQVKGGDKENYLLGNSNRFEVVGAETFESLDYEGKFDAVKKAFQYGDFRSISDNTRSKVSNNFFGKDYEGEGSLMRAKDWGTRKHVAESMNYLKNKVDRASCGGTRGSGMFRMKVSKDESDDTIAHELGHGIAVSFGYDYEGENASEEYGPYNLSHEYTNYAGSWSGYIDWDLSEDSNFYDPEQYMFTKWDGEGNADKYAVGADAFMDEVDEEVKQEYKEEEVQREAWESVEYETPDEDATAQQVFESLSEGDLVRFNVPDWDEGRDEDGNPLDTTHDVAKFSRIEENTQDGHPYLAIFERENGDNWRWPMDSDGNLYSDWSSVDGVAVDPEIPDQDEDSDSSGGIPPEQQADSLTEHLATRWNGFNEEAEATEEKAENLMRAVNRAWYKQAKVHEASDDPTDRQKVVMETGYSATNAHETMAQLHEVMQTPTDSNKQRANDIFDEHPYLILAYMDMWEPSPEILEEMQELLQALGIEI